MSRFFEINLPFLLSAHTHTHTHTHTLSVLLLWRTLTNVR